MEYEGVPLDLRPHRVSDKVPGRQCVQVLRVFHPKHLSTINRFLNIGLLSVTPQTNCSLSSRSTAVILPLVAKIFEEITPTPVLSNKIGLGSEFCASKTYSDIVFHASLTQPERKIQVVWANASVQYSISTIIAR
jgi:hypothetical protein